MGRAKSDDSSQTAPILPLGIFVQWFASGSTRKNITKLQQIIKTVQLEVVALQSPAQNLIYAVCIVFSSFIYMYIYIYCYCFYYSCVIFVQWFSRGYARIH